MVLPLRLSPIAMLAVAFAVGGCSAPVPHAAAPDAALTQPERWELVELMGKPIDARTGQSPWMRFESKGSRVHGFSGCNRFSGTYELEPGNRIRFSRVAATQMACPDVGVEMDFHRAVSGADSFNVNGEDLALHRARMAPLARFKATMGKTD